VWSDLVVILPLILDDISCMLQADKPVRVQTLVPESTVEVLDESILDRFPRTYEIQLHTFTVRPLVQGTSREFRSVADSDDFWQAPGLCY